MSCNVLRNDESTFYAYLFLTDPLVPSLMPLGCFIIRSRNKCTCRYVPG